MLFLGQNLAGGNTDGVGQGVGSDDLQARRLFADEQHAAIIGGSRENIDAIARHLEKTAEFQADMSRVAGDANLKVRRGPFLDRFEPAEVCQLQPGALVAAVIQTRQPAH